MIFWCAFQIDFGSIRRPSDCTGNPLWSALEHLRTRWVHTN